MSARSQTPTRAATALVGPSLRLCAISVVTLALALALESAPSTVAAQGEWQPLSGAEVRFGHSALYDEAARQMTVLVGAETLLEGGEPLSLDLAAGTWAPLHTTGQAPRPPSGRGPVRGSGMVVDDEERVALLECDCDGGSTFLYELDGRHWNQAPNDSTVQVVGGALVYDSIGDRAVLVGGRQYGLDLPLAQALWYDLSDRRSGWHSLPSVPVSLVNASAAFAESAGHVVVFGGQNDDGDFLDRLWALELTDAGGEAEWREITDAAGPGPTGRVGASFVFVPQRQVIVLYGGYAPGNDSEDVWLLDYSVPSTPKWVLVMPESPGPRTRAAHSAIWDEAGDRLVVYGGTRGDGSGIELLSDVWALPADALVPGPTPTPMTSAMPSPTPSSTPSPTPGPTHGPTESPEGPARLWLPVAHRPPADR